MCELQLPAENNFNGRAEVCCAMYTLADHANRHPLVFAQGDTPRQLSAVRSNSVLALSFLCPC